MTTSIQTKDPTEATQRTLVYALERLGWCLTNAEINNHLGTARVELRRGDLLVTLDARNHRATITRERVHTTTEVLGRRGDRYRADRLHTEFLGRTRYDSTQQALQALALYVEDNAAAHSLPTEHVLPILTNMHAKSRTSS